MRYSGKGIDPLANPGTPVGKWNSRAFQSVSNQISKWNKEGSNLDTSTGGSEIYNSGGYRIHRFNPNTTQTFTASVLKSEYPVEALIIAGGGIRISDNILNFSKFIKKNNIPFVTSWASQDITKYDEKLYFGSVGRHGNQCANEIISMKNRYIELCEMETALHRKENIRLQKIVFWLSICLGICAVVSLSRFFI
jgi:hypothetical protein